MGSLAHGLVCAKVLLARGVVVSVFVAVDEPRFGGGALEHPDEKIRHQPPFLPRQLRALFSFRQVRVAVEPTDMEEGQDRGAGHGLFKGAHELSTAVSHLGSVIAEAMGVRAGLTGIVPESEVVGLGIETDAVN